jgi:long-chain acyl-CoA synthetase
VNPRIDVNTAPTETERYEDLFNYARATAHAIVHGPCPPATSRALRVYAAALMLLHYPPRSAAQFARTVAHDALDALAADWPDVASGRADGEDLMLRRPGLWARLMTEWPMMAYADGLLNSLASLSAIPADARILEVGSGVGNTTKRLGAVYGERLTWSDRGAAFIRHGNWVGTAQLFDFDHEPPSGLGPFDVIVATNALHCAANLGWTLRRLRQLLVPGGLLAFAEGSSPTRPDGTPWALDVFFSAFDGWWNRSGFRTRAEWFDALTAQGFTGIGYTTLTAGHDDLGGSIWAIRAR